MHSAVRFGAVPFLTREYGLLSVGQILSHFLHPVHGRVAGICTAQKLK